MLRRPRTSLLALPLVLLSLAACATTPDANAGTASTRAGTATGTAATSPAAELRLGYFANVTHATAVYGVGTGAFADALGSTTLRPQIFNAGPAAVEALFAGSLDAAYVGPGPAVNAFTRSDGEAIRIVSGATSGGASLVVQPGITDADGLRGKQVASPQTGGTQDIALRTWLADNGLRTDEQGGGDATIVAQENSQTLQLFQAGRIDGAWVPEPWASRLVLEGGGTVLVDEKTLWPQGRFVSTHLIVRTPYLEQHPETITALLTAQVAVHREINGDGQQAKTVVNEQLDQLTGKPLAPAAIDRAFAQITVTEDPIATSLKKNAEDAFATGLVEPADLEGIYDLSLLEDVLGREVDDAGLGG